MREEVDEFVAWYQAEPETVVRAMTFVAGSPEVAREVVAEASTRAYERWHRVRQMGSRTWTCGGRDGPFRVGNERPWCCATSAT